MHKPACKSLLSISAFRMSTVTGTDIFWVLCYGPAPDDDSQLVEGQRLNMNSTLQYPEFLKHTYNATTNSNKKFVGRVRVELEEATGRP
ncbi:unnamed protein product [Urochloa humidicola]